MADGEGPDEGSGESLRTESEDTLEAQLVQQGDFDEEDMPDGLYYG